MAKSQNGRPHAIPETLVRELSGGPLVAAQQETLDRVAETDWRTTSLVLGNAADETFAAGRSSWARSAASASGTSTD